MGQVRKKLRKADIFETTFDITQAEMIDALPKDIPKSAFTNIIVPFESDSRYLSSLNLGIG